MFLGVSLPSSSHRDLLRRKRELEALLPLLSSTQSVKVRDELVWISNRLGQVLRQDDGKVYLRDSRRSAAGLNGVGGLQFSAKAPPGQGRLVRVPFYLYEGNATQASFVQEFYGDANINQVMTLTVTDGGTGAAQDVTITLGDAPIVILGVLTAPLPSTVAAFLATVDYLTTGLGWSASNVPGSPDVVFTCLAFGPVTGLFSLDSTVVGIVSGVFAQDTAGVSGAKEVRRAAFRVEGIPNPPPTAPISVLVFMGTSAGSPFSTSVAWPPPVPATAFLRNLSARNQVRNDLNGDVAYLATWAPAANGTNFLLVYPTLVFTSLADGPIVGPPPYSASGTQGPEVRIETAWERVTAGVTPIFEKQILTITAFGTPGPPTAVDVTLNGVLHPPILVAGGVSLVSVAIDIAAAYALDPDWVAVQVGNTVEFTANTAGPRSGAYSLVWVGATLIAGAFATTTLGQRLDWLASNQPLWLTGNGPNLPDLTRPTVIVTIPNAPGFTTVRGFRFRTPQIEWAKLRIVGFSNSTTAVPRGEYANPPIISPVWPQLPMTNDFPFNDLGKDYSGQVTPGPVIPVRSNAGALPMSRLGYSAYWRGSSPILLVRGLNVGGSANLFIQQGYIDAISFSDMLDEFSGLRANPILESPNQAYIEAAVSGMPLTSLSFTLDLVCEILDDRDLGSPIPGPYARRDALMRYDPPDGQGFVR